MRDQANLYLQYIRYQKKLSDNTLESYTRDLRDFCDYTESNGIVHPAEVSLTDLLRYVGHLESKNKSNATLSRMIASLRSFFGYMYDERMIDNNPTRQLQSPKIDKKLPEIMTIDEVDRLLKQPDLTTPVGMRDQAMLELMYASGLRVTELISLDLNSVNLNLSFVKTSGSQNDRIVPMTALAAKAIGLYLEQGRDHLLKSASEHEGALFLNYSGTRLTRQGFWKLIKQYAKQAQIENSITPHTLRHSFAVHLLQNGADLKSIQEMLGHADLSSTQLYVELSKDQLKHVYEKAHPRA